MTVLRHAGSARPDAPKPGNTQYKDGVYAGRGGLARSCGKCGTHTQQAGGWKHPFFGWVGACCKPKEVAK